MPPGGLVTCGARGFWRVKAGSLGPYGLGYRVQGLGFFGSLEFLGFLVVQGSGL